MQRRRWRGATKTHWRLGRNLHLIFFHFILFVFNFRSVCRVQKLENKDSKNLCFSLGRTPLTSDFSIKLLQWHHSGFERRIEIDSKIKLDFLCAFYRLRLPVIFQYCSRNRGLNKKCILGAIIFILPSSLETEAKTISERPRGMTFWNLSLQHRATKISKVQII